MAFPFAARHPPQMLDETQQRLLKSAGLHRGPTAPLHGGDISKVVRLGRYVLKTARNGVQTDQFLQEADGLRALAERGCKTPAIQHVDSNGLVLNFYEQTVPTDLQYAEFAESLAALHRNTESFESHANHFYLGALSLPMGPPNLRWGPYFVYHRLAPLIERAQTDGHDLKFINLDKLANSEFPIEGACLIHGDLWTGNILSTADGILMIDPSCWFGERAVDLAMLTLFGTLPDAFWRVYCARYPIPDLVRQYFPIYQLYYALAHVCLFGSSYIPMCRRLWRKFSP